MKATMRIYCVLALLCMGSAGINAQDTDPFGEVDITKYSNTMTITGHVRMNGELLGDGTVVAVYQGDELRGKGIPVDKSKYKKLLMMSIFGDTKGQALHFKVYTGGRVIEVDQGLTYLTDQRVGTLADPYYIDLPAPIVTNFSTEGWATTCVPFNAAVPDGVTIYYGTGIEDEQLMMTEVTGKVLPKEIPVLLKGTGGSSCEWLSRVADGDITATGNIFAGTTEETTVEANTVLTLGHAKGGTKEIGFWLFSGTTIPANRAYIDFFPSGLRGVTFHGDGVETAILDVAPSAEVAEHPVYDLQGRRVTDAARLVPGTILISNGRKFISK